MAAALTLPAAAALTTATADLVTTGRYCTLAAWVLLLYDHAVHLDKEIELFWSQPWSVAKCLYFFNRYTSPFFLGIHAMIFLSPNVSDGLCLGWFKFEGYTGTIGIASVELILGFRVLALWNRNKWIVAIVGFAVFAEITTMLAILSSAYVHMQAISHLDASIPYTACVPLNVPPYFFAFWLPPLGYEFLVFVLAATKGYHTLRYSFSWGTGEFTFKSTGSRLLEVMIRDSLWYFLLIFACDMVCSLIWLKGPNSLLQAVVGFGLVIPSVAGSHLLLNLRDAYYHPSGTRVTTANSTGWTSSTDVSKRDGSGRGAGKKRTPTFGRSNDILASGGRHRVAQLDTQWALDPEQDDIDTVHGGEGGDQSKLELGAGGVVDDDVGAETIPTGSQRRKYFGGASTIQTSATISTMDDPPHPPPIGGRRSSDTNGVGDAYVYSARQLSLGGSTGASGSGSGGGGGFDADAGGSATSMEQQRRPAGVGESYELQHVQSNGTAHTGMTTALDAHSSPP